jgi:putative heme iron utilization protein
MSGYNIHPARSREKSAGHSWEEGHVPCSAESHQVTDSDLRLYRLRLAGRAANVSFGYHGQAAYCQYHPVR